MEPQVMNQVQPPLIEHAFGNQDRQFPNAFQLLEDGLHQHVTPGAVVGVTLNQKLIVWKSFGRFTHEADSPAVWPDTIFDLASVTKAVATTTTAMLLYERGMLRPEMKASEFFLEFASGAKHEVTLAMLLSHSSGLPGYEKLFLRCKTRAELIAAAAATPLAYSPGTRSEYSDLGFILLGEILTHIAGESLAEFTLREIFSPLAMATATYCPAPELCAQIPPTQDDREFRHRTIQGEVDDENASVMGGIAGHAGLFANAHDLALFSECMLRGGAPILHPETVRRFTTRQSTPAGTSFALGWDTPSPPSQSGHLLSPSAYGHLGYTGTSLWIDPERRLSITLLTNRTWPHRESQAIKKLRPQVHDAIVESL
jgi:serine-type D-Ala-D-Ala carboxypeptidase